MYRALVGRPAWTPVGRGAGGRGQWRQKYLTVNIICFQIHPKQKIKHVRCFIALQGRHAITVSMKPSKQVETGTGGTRMQTNIGK